MVGATGAVASGIRGARCGAGVALADGVAGRAVGEFGSPPYGSGTHRGRPDGERAGAEGVGTARAHAGAALRAAARTCPDPDPAVTCCATTTLPPTTAITAAVTSAPTPVTPSGPSPLLPSALPMRAMARPGAVAEAAPGWARELPVTDRSLPWKRARMPPSGTSGRYPRNRDPASW